MNSNQSTIDSRVIILKSLRREIEAIMSEASLSEIPSKTIRNALRETIGNKLNSKTYTVHVSSASTAGENNFIGVVYRVVFSKENDLKNGEKLILKIAPQQEVRRTQFFSRELFLQEIFMYNEVLPSFRQFELSKGVNSKEGGFIEYPKCYRTVDEEPNESLFLEDLTVSGFDIIDRYTEETSADHVRLVMQALGKFHAISFALHDQQPDKFNRMASQLKETFFRTNYDLFRDYYNKQTETVYNLLQSAEDAHLLNTLKKLFEKDVIDVANDCLDTELGSVIGYGDAWQNNSMFRCDSNGKPIELKFIDWQVSRHSSPIVDIVYFIFSCTTKELRDEHYNDFLNVYHESLSTHIKRLGSNPEKLFPYSLMLEHFHKFGKLGLIFAIVILPVITMEKGNGIDLDEISAEIAEGKLSDDFDNTFISEKSRSKFNKRLRDVVVDMGRLGYI